MRMYFHACTNHIYAWLRSCRDQNNMQIVHAWKVRIRIKATAAVTDRKINKRNKVEVCKVIILTKFESMEYTNKVALTG